MRGGEYYPDPAQPPPQTPRLLPGTLVPLPPQHQGPVQGKHSNKPTDGEGELPVGWEKIFDTVTLRIVYLDHNTKSVSLTRPPPAIRSTLSQDFASGISNVRDLNLRNFSGSAKPPVRSIKRQPPPRPLAPGSSSSSPSPSPSPSPIDSSPPSPSPPAPSPTPLASPIVGHISSRNRLGDQPKLDSFELEPSRNSDGPRKIRREPQPSTEQRALMNPETLVTMTSTGAKRAVDSIKQDNSLNQRKRLKASDFRLSGSPFSPISQDPADDSISDHVTGEVFIDQNAGDTANNIIIHEVDCGGSRGRQYYEDTPKSSPQVPGHFIGENQILDVKQYLASFPDLGFVVCKEYSCNINCDGGRHTRNSKPGVQMLTKQLLKAPSPEIEDENISIIAPSLRKAIEGVATYPAGVMGSRAFKSFLTFSKPYEFFFHHMSQLKGTLHNTDAIISPHVSWLLEHLLETEGKVFEAANDLFAQGLVSDDCLPYLFCPNELIILQENGDYIAAILGQVSSTKAGELNLACWTWGPPTSSGMGRKVKLVTVGGVSQDDRVKITELKAYPSRFASKEVIDLIKKRGQAFWHLRHPILVSYSGWDFQSEQQHVDTRFMIDYNTYQKMHPFAPVFFREAMWDQERGVKSVDNRPVRLRLDEDPSDENLMLLPPNVHGFDMQEKKWFNLSVDNVKEVEWNVEAFKLLVLPKPTKDLIQALIEIRASKEDMSHIMKRQDIMGGKGQGLIMLLHGGPGTGKTLTAESVAETAKMPLYRVTCGDIGTNAEEVEKYLQNILYLGKAWNCVLLLDEADIFLEQRSLSDLKRNSLVSVFLRILEYYEGILILTTNRIGTFDEAFRSRIQISLHYAKLSPEFQRRIWQNFFNMLRTDGENADLEELEDHLQELSGKDMNGREIRNALATARQLALHKKEMLSWRHLDLAIQTAGNFSRYLKDVHGGEAEDLARENRDR